MAEQLLPRFAVDPEAVIIEAVTAAEPELSAAVVEQVLLATVRQRPARRELARTLYLDAGLLTSGRPEGPRSVERLIRALRQEGATQLELPQCASCHRQLPLPGLDRGQRI
ncbi:hypothetical protein ACFV4X_12570 [Streptomyces ardesiacus]|uniref:hypothetical protein n=1 Tax=Streptomyces ardesiacus TaxID=285564 RepID=UPI00365D4CD1